MSRNCIPLSPITGLLFLELDLSLIIYCGNTHIQHFFSYTKKEAPLMKKMLLGKGKKNYFSTTMMIEAFF